MTEERDSRECCGSCEAYKESHRGSGSWWCTIRNWCYAPCEICSKYTPRTTKARPILMEVVADARKNDSEDQADR